MLKKFTVIFAAVIFLVAAADLFADEGQDGQKAPTRRARIQKQQAQRQRPEALTAPKGAKAVKQQSRKTTQTGRPKVEKRTAAVTTAQPQLRAQRPPLQIADRWFNALKDAYRENDREKIGQLIRRMEQLRKGAREQLKAAQPVRPQIQQRLKEARAEQQKPLRRQQMQRRGLRQQSIDEKAPPLRRQAMAGQRFQRKQQDRGQAPQRKYRMQQKPRMRMQGIQGGRRLQMQTRGLRQQSMGGEGRRPGQSTPYGMGFQQGRLRQQSVDEEAPPLRRRVMAGQRWQQMQRRGLRQQSIDEEAPPLQGRLRQQRGWQQQRWQPKENIPKHQESDFDWDW